MSSFSTFRRQTTALPPLLGLFRGARQSSSTSTISSSPSSGSSDNLEVELMDMSHKTRTCAAGYSIDDATPRSSSASLTSSIDSEGDDLYMRFVDDEDDVAGMPTVVREARVGRTAASQRRSVLQSLKGAFTGSA
ncbi:hypothetical protein DFJ77DRAFT_440239 [Powellomyces hirtus]|nr:hypothetical protein DFJ77DRAFT_440239 [Powellomyces hirtus]